MAAAFYVIRATVADPGKRRAFDEWYHREHFPDAAKALGAVKAWRFWSVSDPSVHQAMYQVVDQATLKRAIGSEVNKKLVAEFDRAWPGVTRTREILVLAEEYGAG
jgi:hypothetical protein